MLFEALSGLKISMAKSIMVGLDVMEEVMSTAKLWGYEVGSWSLLYLGMPLVT